MKLVYTLAFTLAHSLLTHPLVIMGNPVELVDMNMASQNSDSLFKRDIQLRVLDKSLWIKGLPDLPPLPTNPDGPRFRGAGSNQTIRTQVVISRESLSISVQGDWAYTTSNPPSGSCGLFDFHRHDCRPFIYEAPLPRNVLLDPFSGVRPHLAG
jgi:hypothetical protein